MAYAWKGVAVMEKGHLRFSSKVDALPDESPRCISYALFHHSPPLHLSFIRPFQVYPRSMISRLSHLHRGRG